MKRTSLINRILAMLLVVIMTVQLLPLSAFAKFGDLQSWNPGVDLSTLKQEDAINWPIKIYDYLSDGMLFEWMDTNTKASNSSPNIPYSSSDEGSVTPYGGGYKPPVVKMGVDFTYQGAATATDYDAYNDALQEAVDFKTPRYLKISGKGYQSGTVGNYQINAFGTAKAQNEIRYVTVVYRSSGLASVDLTLALHNGSWNRTSAIYMSDSSTWTYKVIDLNAYRSAAVSNITAVYFMWGYNSGKGRGMPSGAYCDISHVAYFNNEVEAKNFGAEAVKFDKNPGEYLGHKTDKFTASHNTVTLPKRSAYLNNIFSLNYCWKNKDTTPKMFDSASNTANVRYGLDFTTHSTANGWKTNAYTSDTFWTWSNGTALSLKNTVNNVTKTESFSMSKIEVEQKTQSNGAQYVTLTSANPSKLLLSKFREDHQLVQEGYVPLTADVDYMVMVYRANGWTSSDKYGLWAHGYLDSSSPDSHKTANYWKYAGLTKTSDWMSENTINQLSLSGDSGWQYALVPISETIGATDSNMSDIDRIANLGIYLPALKDGKSLDIAYVAYFKNNPNASDGLQFDAAHTFGQQAVKYMNAAATVTPDRYQTDYTYANNRVWHGGGNKSFGMLYSSNGGKYLPNDQANSNGNSGGEATGATVYEYGYDFDTWMIGYRTNAQSSNAFNTARYNLVYNTSTGKYEKVKFTAKYTTTGTSTSHDNVSFQYNATGTTNFVYFLAATEEDTNWGSNDGNSDNGKDFNTTNVKFDGYQLLETITSGVMTAGLMEGGLQTVTVNGINYRVPVYRQETVEYIAYNLLYGLRVPMKDADGNYNTRYIKGTESTKFGGVDLNGDGQIGWINYDGDSRNGNELNEASVDLATALRHELGMTPVPATV